MADYVNLDTIHEPADGDLVPAAWGHGIRQDFDALHRPYAFAMVSSPPVTVGNDSVTELGFNYALHHTGEFFTQTDDYVSTFTAPADGYYVANLNVYVDCSALVGGMTTFVALMFKDDTDDGHYLLRSSANVEAHRFTIGGVVRLEAGTNLAFVGYQDCGGDATFEGDCSMIYLGRLL